MDAHWKMARILAWVSALTFVLWLVIQFKDAANQAHSKDHRWNTALAIKQPWTLVDVHYVRHFGEEVDPRGVVVMLESRLTHPEHPEEKCYRMYWSLSNQDADFPFFVRARLGDEFRFREMPNHNPTADPSYAHDLAVIH